MGVRAAAVEATIGIALLGGGLFALDEALSSWDEYNAARACATRQYAGAIACQDEITAPAVLAQDGRDADVWSGIALAGGVLALVVGYDALVEAGKRDKPTDITLRTTNPIEVKIPKQRNQEPKPDSVNLDK